MLAYVLNDVLNRQMSIEQINVLEEFLTALEKITGTDIEEAFKVEARNHHVFDVFIENIGDMY